MSEQSNKNKHNQVRQVLMNELGLTRESVREHVREITEEVVKRKIREMLDSKYMHDLVEKTVAHELTPEDGTFGRRDELRKIVHDCATKQVGELLKIRLR